MPNEGTSGASLLFESGYLVGYVSGRVYESKNVTVLLWQPFSCEAYTAQVFAGILHKMTNAKVLSLSSLLLPSFANR